MANGHGNTPVFSTQSPFPVSVTPADTITPEMTFEDAARLWMSLKAPVTADGRQLPGYIRSNTLQGYQSNIRSLNLFFDKMRLCDITLNHLARYQRLRVQGAAPFIRKRQPHKKEPQPCPAKPQQVNQELGLLIRILKKATLWDEERERLFEFLTEDIAEMQRALTPEEQRRWLDVARSHPRWNVVYWYSLVAFDTCMSTNELRGLRLGDINLLQRMVRVPRDAAKNAHRHRDIEIASRDALWALECLVHRAQELGATLPHHYLFPLKVTRALKSYPDQPMTVSGIKKLWEEVRIASGLTWFRQYDCRHTAISRLAEGGTPLLIIMKRAGHISAKMTEHYTHISDKIQIHSIRTAQQYNGGLGVDPSANWISPPVQYAAPPRPPAPLPAPAPPSNPGDLLGQLLRTLQEQCGLTAEQMREALLAQTQPAAAVPSNIVEFRSR